MSARPAALRRASPQDARPFAMLDGVARPVFVLAGPGEPALVYVNAALCKVANRPAQELLAGGLGWLPQDAARRVLAGAARALEQGKAECCELDPDGTCALMRRVEVDGRRYCVVTQTTGLTVNELDRSRAELRHRTELMSTAIDLEAMAAWSWNRERDEIRLEYRSSQPDAPRIGARTLAEFLDRIHDLDRERVSATVHGVLERGGVGRYEYRIRTADDSERWFSSIVRPLLDAHGGVVGLVGATRDITARKDAYRSIAENAERLRLILEAEPECVKIVDGGGLIRLMNPAGLALVQAEEEREVLGCPVVELVAPEHRVAFENYHRHVMAGESGVLEFEVIGLKGRRRWMESNAAPFRNSRGETVAMLAVARDVTQRRQLEREIIDAASREQQRIGHDLHDGLGQELTGIALMLKGLQGQLGRPAAELDRELDEILKLVNDALRNVRWLAHGLSPVALEHGGLAAALRQLVDRTRGSAQLHVRLVLHSSTTRTLEPSIALHLYRIAQEAVSNVLHHASATRLTVSLNVSRGEARLRITDDGTGVPADCGPAGGLGLRTMAYRAQLIGAVLKVRRRPQGGTLVAVTLPSPFDRARAS